MWLYAITDRHQMGPDPLAAVRRLIEVHEGRLSLQLREKDLSPSALYRWGEALLRLLPGTAQLLINGRPDLARSLGPRVGVHLPAAGLRPSQVRSFLGEAAPLAYSCHSPEECAALARAGADWVTLSPIWPSPGKGSALGPAALEAARKLLAGGATQLLALGGVDQARAPEAIEAGADGVAMIRGAWLSPVRR